MRLYLMRHGKAEIGEADNLRPLSPRGISDVEGISKYAAAQGVEIKQIYHSNLLRAQQTATIMAVALNPPFGSKAVEGIEPWGDVMDFIATANTWCDDTMVCGHEPFMGQAALKLQANVDDVKWVNFKTATVAAFEQNSDDQNWNLLWTKDAKTLRGQRS